MPANAMLDGTCGEALAVGSTLNAEDPMCGFFQDVAVFCCPSQLTPAEKSCLVCSGGVADGSAVVSVIGTNMTCAEFLMVAKAVEESNEFCSIDLKENEEHCCPKAPLEQEEVGEKRGDKR
jgi:hypothetical protein